MPAGRPSKYTPEVSAKICSELAQGKSLRTVCKPDDMPSVQTIFTWFRKHSEFLEQYTRAKEESADALTDEMLDISDGTMIDATEVSQARLKIETRKWLASKLKPKKYGDKVQTEITGKDGGAVQFENLTDQQLDLKLQTLRNATNTNTPTKD